MAGIEQDGSEPIGARELKSGDESAAPSHALRALRLWPAVLLLALLWALKLSLPLLDPENLSPSALFAWFLAPPACALLILLWWVSLSRAAPRERILGFLGVIAIAVVTTMLSHPSMHGAGTLLYAAPWGITGFVIALVASGRRLTTRRTTLAMLGALVFFGAWTLLRLETMWGDLHASFSWRWAPTAEDRFLETVEARAGTSTDTPPAIEPTLAEPEWPGFRGPHRDGARPGVTLREDWVSHPPREVWRVPVGPAWSSFAVAGTRLFTQEQRGETECVVCYDARSGAELWTRGEATRFWEAMAGAGPRATPTLAGGRLFTLGATGVLHRLNALTGEPVWRRDIRTDAAREPPVWGFASSPLVTDGVVIVHAGGDGDRGLLAYDVETGDLRWTSPAGDHSYSSPQRAVLDEHACVLMLTNRGLTLVDAADGRLLGEHQWEYEGYRVVQPLPIESASVLLGTGVGSGTRRLDLRWTGDQFATETRWTSRQMSPDFNDAVAHRGHLYGFDRRIFAAIDLATGERAWKQGRYGSGQVLLLPDGDQLLVLSETGELVLLRASPEKHVELARHQVLGGRTWNHPVLVGDRLYVRNGEEAACFAMPMLGTASPEGG